jgi:hypothetical protein
MGPRRFPAPSSVAACFVVIKSTGATRLMRRALVRPSAQGVDFFGRHIGVLLLSAASCVIDVTGEDACDCGLKFSRQQTLITIHCRSIGTCSGLVHPELVHGSKCGRSLGFEVLPAI